MASWISCRDANERSKSAQRTGSKPVRRGRINGRRSTPSFKRHRCPCLSPCAFSRQIVHWIYLINASPLAACSDGRSRIQSGMAGFNDFGKQRLLEQTKGFCCLLSERRLNSNMMRVTGRIGWPGRENVRDRAPRKAKYRLISQHMSIRFPSVQAELTVDSICSTDLRELHFFEAACGRCNCVEWRAWKACPNGIGLAGKWCRFCGCVAKFTLFSRMFDVRCIAWLYFVSASRPVSRSRRLKEARVSLSWKWRM